MSFLLYASKNSDCFNLTPKIKFEIEGRNNEKVEAHRKRNGYSH